MLVVRRWRSYWVAEAHTCDGTGKIMPRRKDLDAAIEELVRRIKKEVARAEAGTVAVGGITKAGNALEEVLKLAAEITCLANHCELRSVLRGRRVAPGLGSYLVVILDLDAQKVRDRYRSRVINGPAARWSPWPEFEDPSDDQSEE